MAFGYDGSVRIKADLNHANFDRGLAAMTGSVKKFGNTLLKVGAAVGLAFGVGALVNFGKESIKLASDIQEVQNVIDVTFGQGARQIEEFAQSAAAAFGLSELSAKQYTGTMGAMLKSSGLATDQAQEMSTTLAGLAGDMASFYNLDTDTAFEKIRAGISGETEPLKQLGINMSVANLEAYALSQGITKVYNAMSPAEQVLLRYNYLLSVTTDAQGDFARTSGSFANQVRLLQLNFDQLRIAVGNALIPIAQAVLPSINAIIEGLTKLAQVFAQVTALLFGKSAEVKAVSGIASSAGAAADATDKLADSTAGAGNAAKKAAKDMKGVLAGFDELNILADNAADSVGGAAGGMGGGVDASIPELELPSYESELGEVDQLGEAFTSLGEMFVEALDNMLAAIPAFRDTLLDFAGNFNDFNQTLYDAFTFPGVLERVKQLGADLAQSFNDLVLAIDWNLWGSTLGAGLNLGLQNLVSFLYTFDWISLGMRLAEFVNGLVDEIDWYAFGQLLWAKFKLGLETLAGFILGLDMPALAQAASNIIMGLFHSMQDTIANIDWAGIGAQIAEFLNGIDWVGVIDAISGALGEMILAALELIGGFIQNADPATLLVAATFLGTKLFGGLINAVIAPLGKEIGANLIKKIAEAIVGGDISGLVTSVGKIIGEIGPTIGKISLVAGGAFTAISNFLEMLGNGFNWANEAMMLLGIAATAVGAILLGFSAPVVIAIAAVTAVVLTVAAAFDEIRAAAISAFDYVVETWNEFWTFIDTNVIQPLVKGWNDFWTGLVQWASDTLDSIQNAWNDAFDWFNTTIIEPLVTFFTEAWETITQLASDAWNGIVSVWEIVSTWFNDTIIEPVRTFFTELWGNIKQLASDAWNGIVDIWNTVSTWFNDTVIRPVAEFFGGLWDGIQTAAGDLWDSIISIWESAGTWFEEHVTEPIGKAFEAVGNFIKGVLNGVIGGVEGLINGAIKAVNWLISQLNKIKFDVPDWVPAIGGKSFGFNITKVSEVSLPRLANGAVIPPNQQFAAILGDQRSGMNIEAPLKTIEQALRNVMGESNFGSDVVINLTAELDGKVLTKKVIRVANAMTRAAGKPVFRN